MKILGNEKGSFLLEGIVAMSLMLLLATSVLPLFVTATAISGKNKLKSVAVSIASKEIEKTKSLSYDDVGTVNGNPSGVIEPDVTIIDNNIEFIIKTRIRWVDDAADGLGGQDSDIRDYKRVTLTVSWKFGEKSESYKIVTNISRESREQIALGGNIQALVKDTDNNPVEDVKVEITSGPSGYKQDWTDEKGEVLFAMLPASQTEGDYSLSVSKSGYIVRPDLTVQTTTVTNNQTRILEFIIGRPGGLSVRLVDSFRELIQKNSRITLNNPDAGEVVYNNSNGQFDISNLFPGAWDINPFAASYYYTGDPITVQIEPSGSQSIEIMMRSRPQAGLHLTVTDSYNSNPIIGADVTVTNVDTGEAITAQTNAQGILELSVEAGTYDIKVEKAGYTTKTERHNLPASTNTNVSISLDRASEHGSILIKTIDSRNGAPRSSVRVRVTGRSYNRTQTTGSNGQALFTNLNPGNYRTYRWNSGWRFPRSVSVTAGQQTIVEYRY